MNVQIKKELKYRLGYIRNGERHLVTPWVSNLIMDAGLNKFATVNLAQCFARCLFGNDVSPVLVRRDGGGVTFTQVGTTITASGSFFIASDTGRLFKYGTGTAGAESYLTYVSATQATSSVFAIVAVPEAGTIWYVNSATLSTVLQTTSTYGTTGGDNETTMSSNIVTMKRTFTGTAVVSPTIITEIGFSDSTTNSNLYDRDIVTGGVALLAGDIPLAVAVVVSTWGPIVSTAQTNVGTGMDTSGNFLIEYFPNADSTGGGSSGCSRVMTTGESHVTGGICLEPSSASYEGSVVVGGVITLQTFSNSAGTSRNVIASGNPALASYISGTFTRTKTHSYTISEANGTIYGFGFYAGFSGGTPRSQNVTWKLTTPFTKTSSDVFNFVYRYTWNRVLTN